MVKSVYLEVAAVLGFGGIAGSAIEIAKILFVVFLILAIVSLVFGRKSMDNFPATLALGLTAKTGDRIRGQGKYWISRKGGSVLEKLSNTFYLLICAALIVPLVGCKTMKKEPNPKVSASDSAKFERDSEEFHSLENQELRAKKLSEEEAAEAADVKKKKEESQDKGEGQVKIKF